MEKPSTIGFLVNDLLSHYQSRLLAGLLREANAHNVRLVVFAGGYLSAGDESSGGEGSFLFDLAKGPVVDGLIVESGILATHVGTRGVLELCRRANVPCVSIGHLPGVPSVAPAEMQGIEALVEHLLVDHNRRRLAFVRGPEGSSSATAREVAFRATLRKHGIPLDERCIVAGNFLEHAGYEAVQLLDSRGLLNDLDAIVAANDLMALGVLTALERRGIDVPSQIAVVGFDDDDLAEEASPSLSTVRQPIDALGAAALNLLCRTMGGEHDARDKDLPVQVVLRRSCGCPASQPVQQSDISPSATEPPRRCRYELRRQVRLAQGLGLVGSALESARDMSGLERLLRTQLPQLGLQSCSVLLFAGVRDSTPMMGTTPRLRLVATYFEATVKDALLQKRTDFWRPTGVPLSTNGPTSSSLTRFVDTNWLTPLPVETRSTDLIVHPLAFAEEALGFVVFAVPDNLRDAWLLEGISGHISSALAAIRTGEKLREASAKAESANATKGEFLATMSHELRTPLTAVLGHLDLALAETTSASQRQRLELAQSSAKSLLRIVNDVLDYSKLEAERVEIESVAFHLDEVFRHVLNACALAAAKKGLELVFNIDPLVPPILVGDPLRVAQILVNLISNATKFSSVGRIVVRLELADRQPDDSVTLYFSVCDTGIGMSTAQLSNLFHPFTQADSSTTRRYGGTGLGLAICQRLAHLLGCEIHASSTPGQGSTFSFCLTVLAPRELSSDTSPETPPRTVLLIEPDEEQAQALSRTIASRGHQVFWTEDLPTAISLIQSNRRRFDMCLCGQAYTANLASNLETAFSTCGLPPPNLVLLTSAAEQGRSWRSSELPQLAKPILPSQLLSVIESPRSGQSRSNSSLYGRTLLLVQDTPTSRDVLTAMLASHGASVVAVETGGQACHEAKQNDFDAILMDVNLPDMDGFEATKRIRKLIERRSTPILGVTADSRKETRVACLAAGMNECIVTPVEASELCRTVCSWLRFGDGEQGASTAPMTSTWTRRSADLFNPERALRQLGGSTQTYRDILGRFVQAYGADALPWANSTSSAPQVELATLHSLVSAAGNVGAMLLSNKAQAFELALRTSAPIEPAEWGALDALRLQTLTLISAYLRDDLSSSAPEPLEALGNHDAVLSAFGSALREHNTKALDLLPSASAILSTYAPPHLLSRLEVAVRAYDFRSSLAIWQQLPERP